MENKDYHEFFSKLSRNECRITHPSNNIKENKNISETMIDTVGVGFKIPMRPKIGAKGANRINK